MTKIKTFFLNGQKYYTNKNINLLELITYFNYNHSLLVIEHNRFICNKKNWNTTVLNDQDKLEIVTITGGG